MAAGGRGSHQWNDANQRAKEGRVKLRNGEDRIAEGQGRNRANARLNLSGSKTEARGDGLGNKVFGGRWRDAGPGRETLTLIGASELNNSKGYVKKSCPPGSFVRDF
jgi:hypothetical protein